jgi:uncharacterized protein (TIGR03663 family)
MYIHNRNINPAGSFKDIKAVHVFVALASAIIVSITFFSSFYTNPQGILDSISTYGVYFTRAGTNQIHIHPWYYYLKLLCWNTGPGNIIWSELLVLVLAACGFTALFIRKYRVDKLNRLLLFIGIYSLILFLIYSFLPYKTPWNIIQFYCGFIILAGFGMEKIWLLISKTWIRVITGLFIFGGIMYLVWQSYTGNFIHYADPDNPYVYAHTSKDVNIVKRSINQIAAIHPDGKDMYIEVVFPGSDYWPLPWYLRDFSHVGWWDKVDFSIPAASVVIASPSVEKDLLKKWHEIPPPGMKSLYMPLFSKYTELRPGLELRGYVRKDIWDKLQAGK